VVTDVSMMNKQCSYLLFLFEYKAIASVQPTMTDAAVNSTKAAYTFVKIALLLVNIGFECLKHNVLLTIVVFKKSLTY
jgi:hypothetical protein